MRWIYAALFLTSVGAAHAQVAYPPVVATTTAPAPDLSGYATKDDVASVDSKASAAASVAAAAQAAASGAVKTVNGVAPTSGNVAVPVPDVSGFATTASMQSAMSSVVKTVNGLTPVAGAVTVPVPTAATAAPPSVNDASALGTQTTVYALANHTHASKARKGRVLVPASGALAVVYRDAQGVVSPFSGSPPICAVTAEATAGDTNVVNAQIDGTPTMNGMTIRITRTAITAASLLGLNILSVPTQIATYAHYVCLEP